jgi:putative acetyltransferase
MILHVRRYQTGEERELRQLFFHTVRIVNRRDYTAAQVRAWAPDAIDEEHWRRRIESNNPFVCLHGDQIVGFADLQTTGYIDHFFVHCQWQGKGVGKRLFATLESTAEALELDEMTSNVSITARPFFAGRGFVVVAAQEVAIGDVSLRNFHMRKRLRAALQWRQVKGLGDFDELRQLDR